MNVLPLPRQPETLDNELRTRSANQLDSDELKSSKNTNRRQGEEPFRFFSLLKDAIWISVRATAKAMFFAVKAAISYLRYHPFHFLLTALLLFLLVLMVITSSGIHAKMIHGKISSETVEELIQASRYTRDFSSLNLNKSGADEIVQVGAPKWAQREAVRAVLFHARRAGLSIEDQAVLLATAEVESGFNPMAKAPTTTACGLFQFVKSTGIRYELSRADCMDPSANARAGVQHYLDNYNRTVASKTSHLHGAEKVFKTYELSYYLHHDGPNSSNPSNDVKAVVLNGTEFLFRAYDILKREEVSQKHAPSFLNRYTEHLFQVLHRMAEYIPFVSIAEVQADQLAEEEATS